MMEKQYVCVSLVQMFATPRGSSQLRNRALVCCVAGRLHRLSYREVFKKKWCIGAVKAVVSKKKSLC